MTPALHNINVSDESSATSVFSPSRPDDTENGLNEWNNNTLQNPVYEN